jgi:hypothetical protein
MDLGAEAAAAAADVDAVAAVDEVAADAAAAAALGVFDVDDAVCLFGCCGEGVGCMAEAGPCWRKAAKKEERKKGRCEGIVGESRVYVCV